MKRSFALLSAAALTTIVAMFILISMLAALVSPTNANQSDVAEQAPAPEVEPQVNVIATAEVMHQQVEATLTEREGQLKDQVAQLQQAVIELDDGSQLQIEQQKARLLEIQAQSNQVSSNIAGLQAHIAALQQAMATDAQTYEAELAGMMNGTAQLQEQLEIANAQLAEAYNRLAQQQAESAASQQNNGPSSSGNSSSSSYQNDDDDHHEHEEDDDRDEHHYEDDDDDDERHHEKEDDDDD